MCVPPAICQIWGCPPGPAASWKLLCQSSGNLTGWQRLLDRQCRFLHPWPGYAGLCLRPVFPTWTPTWTPTHISHCGNHRPPELPPHPPRILISHCVLDFTIFLQLLLFFLFFLTSPSLTLCCLLATRGGRLRGATCPSHRHPCGAHAAHHSCCSWFLLQQEEVMTSLTDSQPPSSLSPHHNISAIRW